MGIVAMLVFVVGMFFIMPHDKREEEKWVSLDDIIKWRKVITVYNEYCVYSWEQKRDIAVCSTKEQAESLKKILKLKHGYGVVVVRPRAVSIGQVWYGTYRDKPSVSKRKDITEVLS